MKRTIINGLVAGLSGTLLAACGGSTTDSSSSSSTMLATTAACYAAWNSTTAYNGGATVSYNGVNYTAAFWTQNQNPSTNNGPAGSGQPWISNGACGATPTPTPTPTPAPTPTPTPAPTPTPTPAPTPTGCTATPINPYLSVNGGAWQNVSSVTVSSGTPVAFGPQPTSGGSWSWANCGTRGTSRSQTITATGSCTSTATYTNTCGAKSTKSFIVTVSAPATLANGQMTVSSFDGAVTQSELNSFRSYIQTLAPDPDNIGNSWAQHNSGQRTKAMGLVFEISKDKAVLDHMLRFCDAVLSERNDLAAAPVGQHVIWTGRIDPVWPNDVTTTPIATGGEQGDPIGHLGYCANLILQSPTIWNATVSIGDPHQYGATYLARAKKYVAEADYALDNHVFKSLLSLPSNRQYFSAASPYQGGNAVPWNQQMMFNYAFQNLADAHAILGDDSARVTRYNGLVQASMNWLFSVIVSYTDSTGRTAYGWGYAPGIATGEDNSHGNLDIQGIYDAYASGKYGITAAKMTPFANMFDDVMTLAPGSYTGTTAGTSAGGNSSPTSYIRAGYLYLSEFRADKYKEMMDVDFSVGATTGAIDQFSIFLWMKNLRYRNGVK